ncbi:3D domain-containing protein [Alicyclobacillus tolerans]|uniref:3D domain-containing protein n=1 Tax=Alicyclobacillus tolerans TaxID=90970 RepID=UPI001F18363B|nr:3D domain-containing protein [Alicyclobacillus tolerans]MCF8565384.1 3D domain-containing protein [Alicyclobacillus tolerans]
MNGIQRSAVYTIATVSLALTLLEHGWHAAERTAPAPAAAVPAMSESGSAPVRSASGTNVWQSLYGKTQSTKPKPGTVSGSSAVVAKPTTAPKSAVKSQATASLQQAVVPQATAAVPQPAVVVPAFSPERPDDVFEQVRHQNIYHISHHVIGDFVLTAYSLDEHSTGKTPGSPGFGITYSGTRAKVNRTVAVDPRVIPIGTPIYIEGLGWRLAEDTGGAVKGRHIDVLLNSEREAYRFGVKRHIRVYSVFPGESLQPVMAED